MSGLYSNYVQCTEVRKIVERTTELCVIQSSVYPVNRVCGVKIAACDMQYMENSMWYTVYEV